LVLFIPVVARIYRAKLTEMNPVVPGERWELYHPMSTNRLSKEKSPYLLAHQHNPVDWYPWGAEAFEKARREAKPIFLSIGYSTCHWCHVMERESFENEAVAALLNEHFVPIKVDREERPDVDRVYMTFVQATTGSGGWPMSVFLTPALVPFLGGAYFPPEDRPGQTGFATLLRRIAQAWRDDRSNIIAHGQEVLDALRESTVETAHPGLKLDSDLMDAAALQLAHDFDPQWGGFSSAPKFPHPAPLNFLFRYQALSPQGPQREAAREMALFTLDKMAGGGIHDALGGGFHRYSVDRFWHVPHFEKMLYDQAQLACVYLDAFQITGHRRYAQVARDTLDYVRRELASPEGGFYCAQDADSPLPENPGKSAEGAFYLWSQAEIESALAAADAALFCQFYGVQPGGNAPGDPQGEFAGKNILVERFGVEDLSRQLDRPAEEIAQSLGRSRRLLLQRRSQRPRPHLDDKIVTAWNGLMLSALARGAQVLDDAVYLECAESTAAFLKKHLWHDGVLRRSYREGASHIAGFAADYAFLIQGLLDLYEAGANIRWLQWAAELQQAQDMRFYDAEQGGYWLAKSGDSSQLLRIKEDYDGAEPSPNSVAALNALRLGQMLDEPGLVGRGEATLRAFSNLLHRAPLAMPQMLAALDFALTPPKRIVFSGSFEETHSLRRELHAHYIPRKIILFADGGSGQAWLARRFAVADTASFASTHAMFGASQDAGGAAAYLCENSTCQPPVTTARGLQGALQAP
jgi:uncharacterized protein YyaL (SSP411 family)